MPELRLVLSCEHASNRSPARYRDLFPKAVLAGHRGWDPGALRVARRLARVFRVPLHEGEVTRLLVDLNRSDHHPRLFSGFVRALDADERARIRQRYYRPYRDRIEENIRSLVDAGFRVLHLSVHSFAPVLDDARRQADIGLLYDPSRRWERELAGRLLALLRADSDQLRIRRNYPYRGVSDGLTTACRKVFSDSGYAGIEVELNQRLLRTPRGDHRVARIVAAAVGEVVRHGE